MQGAALLGITLLLALTSPTRATEGRGVFLDKKIGVWTARGEFVGGGVDREPSYSDPRCSVSSRDLTVWQGLNIWEGSFWPLRLTFNDLADDHFGDSRPIMIMIGSHRWQAHRISVADAVAPALDAEVDLVNRKQRPAEGGASAQDELIAGSDRSFTGVRLDPDSAWLESIALLPDLQRTANARISYETLSSEAGEKKRRRTVKVDVRQLKAAIKACQDALLGQAWLPMYLAQPKFKH